MPSCEMCGKPATLLITEIEGVDLKVCSKCSTHGRVKRSGNNFAYTNYKSLSPPLPKEENEEAIIFDFSSIIRNKREKLSLSQEDFAKLINERESIVAKWEQNTLKPSISQAKALEKKLKIILVKQQELKPMEKEKNKAAKELTIGDFIKYTKRQKDLYN